MDVPRPSRARTVLAALAIAAGAASAAGHRPSPRPPTRSATRAARRTSARCAIASNSSAVGFRIAFADRPSLRPGRASLARPRRRPGPRRAATPTWPAPTSCSSYGIAGDRTFAPELLRWQGGRWQLVPEQRRLVAVVAGNDVLRIALDRRLFPRRSFDWSAFTFQAGRGRGSDSAPDEQAGRYSMRVDRPPFGTPLRSVLDRLAVSPVCTPASRRA